LVLLLQFLHQEIVQMRIKMEVKFDWFDLKLREIYHVLMAMLLFLLIVELQQQLHQLEATLVLVEFFWNQY
jgi:peptidoglycan biosynthesis protein MviN/MurJ (putative lipid II flippase)